MFQFQFHICSVFKTWMVEYYPASTELMLPLRINSPTNCLKLTLSYIMISSIFKAYSFSSWCTPGQMFFQLEDSWTIFIWSRHLDPLRKWVYYCQHSDKLMLTILFNFSIQCHTCLQSINVMKLIHWILQFFTILIWTSYWLLDVCVQITIFSK